MNDTLQIYDEGLQELLTGILSLSTFADVREWGERAEVEIEHIKSHIRALDIENARDSQSLEKLKYERSKKMLGGLLGGSKEEKELSQRFEDRKTSKSGLTKAINQLQDVIDFTPRSQEEKQSLLSELHQRKRTLQEKKREITQVVRGPRLNRPPELATDTVFSAATRERRQARYDREAEVKAGETTIAALTRQIEQAERDIQWVEKFEN
ncbi:MAG: hypothetical protein HYZ22_02655 [Chloroflexi bacterium]|nr:hypothetical protein [Chloroflexota bacterium]